MSFSAVEQNTEKKRKKEKKGEITIVFSSIFSSKQQGGFEKQQNPLWLPAQFWALDSH